ncbi:glutamate-5-semialdehyde dehydrogenase, partial [Blastomonas sp.]|uniref:glutamate-5-semialdehyde dehydrogenase n=1 Tax=Blastomonas sp. TaxID=1909299 RepID=UPI0035937FA7
MTMMESIATTTDTNDARDHVLALGTAACAAARQLARADTDTKNRALRAAAEALRAATPALIAANAADIAELGDSKPASFIDRLRLDEGRIAAIAQALDDIAALPDPVGRELAQFKRPNGLDIRRIAVPIGVIAMIYESRPNVGADASALCIKSGNAIILRGGSESARSTKAIVGCMQAGLKAAGLPLECVQTVGTTDRAAVTELLHATEHIDLAIPRGGRGLVELVRREARVPTLLHLDGNCHSYVHAEADIAQAVAIIRNAKLRRTGVCGAMETLLIDRAWPHSEALIAALEAAGCEIRRETDFGIEFLDATAAVGLVDGLDGALAHIAEHGSGHTDAIVTEDTATAERFLAEADSAI